jgi:putative aldouronate transport system substrate-binding protein
MQTVRFLLLVLALAALPVLGFAAGEGEAAADDMAEGKLSPTPFELRMMVIEDEAQPMRQDAPAVAAAFEATNVQLMFEPVPQLGYDEKKNVLLATANIPDVIQVRSNDIQQFARSGIFLPISDYLEQMPNFAAEIASRPDIDTLRVDGKLYGFPILEKQRIRVAPQPQIRMDLLQKTGLEVPTTFEELFSVLQAMKRDDPNIIGVGGRNGTKYVLGQWAFPLGSGGFPGFTRDPVYYEPKSDRYVYGPAAPHFEKVLRWFNRLYEAGLLDREYVMSPWDNYVQKVTTGKIVMIWDNSTFPSRVFNPGLQAQDPTANFQVISPLQNEDGEIRSYIYYRDWLNSNYAVSAKAKNPEAIIAFYDWLYGPEGTLISNFGKEGVTFDYDADGNPKVIDSLFNEYQDKPDAYTALQSYMGVGLQAWAVQVIEQTQARISPPEFLAHAATVEQTLQDGLAQFMRYNPPMNEDEIEQLKNAQPRVDNLMEREIDKFITGERALSEFEAFRQDLIKNGAQEVEEVYNTAYRRMRGQ